MTRDHIQDALEHVLEEQSAIAVVNEGNAQRYTSAISDTTVFVEQAQAYRALATQTAILLGLVT